MSSRGQSNLLDPNLISGLKNYLTTKLESDSTIGRFTDHYGFPIWDKAILIDSITADGKKFVVLPCSKPESIYVEAIVTIAIDANNQMEMGGLVTRIRESQLVASVITCESVSHARIISKFDYEIFRRIDNFHYVVSEISCNDESVDERTDCRTYWMSIACSLLGVSQAIGSSDGAWIWYWTHAREMNYFSFAEKFCEDLNKYDWYLPENPIPGGGAGGGSNGLPYISDIEKQYATQYHNTQMQYNPNYLFMMNNYQNCGQHFGGGAKSIVLDLFRKIIQDNHPTNSNQLSENAMIAILNSGLSNDVSSYSSNLKNCIESGIELLAQNGVLVSFNAALKTAADNASDFQKDLKNLCLFSEVSNSDKAYLDAKENAKADLMTCLNDCPYSNNQDNIAIINAFIAYAKTFAISNYKSIDLCSIKNTGSVVQNSDYLIRYLNAGAPAIGTTQWAEVLDFALEQASFGGPNAKEILWAITHPQEALSVQFFILTARERQTALYGHDANVKWLGKGDAFLHTYWNALNTVAIGETLAKEVGDNHEDSLIPELHLEWEMDFFNNAVGRAIGVAHPYPEGDIITLEAFVLSAMSNGECRYLKPVDHEISKAYDGGQTPGYLNGILPFTIMIPTNE